MDALKFAIQEEILTGTKIKVVGVSGGGSNAVAIMMNEGLQCFFFFQAEDGIRARNVTGVQTCALPISSSACCSANFTATNLSPSATAPTSSTPAARCTPADCCARANRLLRFWALAAKRPSPPST